MEAPLSFAPLIVAPLSFAPLITVLHAALTAVLVAGVLFSSTRIQHMAILSTLLILLFGIRMNGGCCVTHFEGRPTLTQLEKAMYLQHDEPSLSDKTFEEILVCNLAWLHIVRVLAFPVKELFEP